jgi:Bifunctional DNA primase/polymerase, N-terminal
MTGAAKTRQQKVADEPRSRLLRDRAPAYVGFGWALVPVVSRSKEPHTALLRELYGRPTLDHLKHGPALAEEVEEWFRLEPELNLGVFPSNSLALIDIDHLDLLNPKIPTPTASSGREGGGRHLYLSCDRLLPTKKTKWGHLNPAHLVVPGSIHESGRMYEWLPGLSPDEVSFMDYREALPLLGLEVSSSGS